MTKTKIEEFQKELENKSAEEIIRWALGYFDANSIALASSLGAEDQVLTDMLVKENKKARIFTLDTGRLPQETYDVLDATRKRYGINIEILFPETKSIESMEKEYGSNLFYDSVEKRKMCCNVRKVQPLKRKLSGLKAWICGLRKDQSVTRGTVNKIEWDETSNLFKINPLADWTQEKVWNYIRENNVPYNKLHDKGYPSIGCAPCTRAVQPGEDIRAGRWWWENPEHKECGLHIKKQL